MNKTILKSILFMPILGFMFYNDINWITGISGASVYIIYNFFIHYLSIIDIFQ